MCARWSPVLLSGDGHTSVRGRREAPRDEADLCWQLLLQLLCIFQFQVQRRAAMTGLDQAADHDMASFHFSACLAAACSTNVYQPLSAVVLRSCACVIRSFSFSFALRHAFALLTRQLAAAELLSCARVWGGYDPMLEGDRLETCLRRRL